MGMVRIWKYKIDLKNEVNIEMPQTAKILCVRTQGNTPNIWAMVDPDLPSEVRTFTIITTGQPIPVSEGPLNYIGSFQPVNSTFVGHLFERI